MCIKKHLFIDSEIAIKLLFIFDANREWCLSVCWYIKNNTILCMNVLRSGSLPFSTVPQIRSALPAVWERAAAGRRRIRNGDDHRAIKQSDAFLKCWNTHAQTHTHTHTHTHTPATNPLKSFSSDDSVWASVFVATRKTMTAMFECLWDFFNVVGENRMSMNENSNSA